LFHLKRIYLEINYPLRIYHNPDAKIGRKVEFKFNLRNIKKYTYYLSECTESIRNAIIKAENCHGCEKACGGILFEFDGIKYCKCPWHVFRFWDLSEKAVKNYAK
jgi:hypothetical protein